MNGPRIACFVATLVLAAPIDLPAQEPARLAPGNRVRVTAPSVAPEPLLGFVVKVVSDTFVLALKDRFDRVALPFASVTKLEVTRGKTSKPLAGLGIGFLVGAGFGTMLGAASDPSSGDIMRQSTAGCAALGPAVFGAFGGSLGLAIGALVEVDTREEVPLERLRVSVVPQQTARLSVGLRLKL